MLALVRALRNEIAGAHYHVMSRGNEKQNIFRSRSDRTAFLRMLSEVCTEQSWQIHTYCLMNNHFHLIVETPEKTLAIGMKALCGVYAQWFNARHGRVGHLYQGRYVSRLIEKDEYFLALQRYILQNPVRAGLCCEAVEWEWSSYSATIGISPRPDFLDPDFALGFFSDGGNSVQAFIEYVSEKSVPGPWMSSTMPLRVAREQNDLRSIITSRHDRDARNVQILEAFDRFGFTMTEIAHFLEVTPAAVSKIISRMRRERGKYSASS